MLAHAQTASVLPPDPPASAEAADLLYINDGEPGIRRRRAGRGFFYVDAAGRRVEDEATMARIRSLAIPPAWTDVWIAPTSRGHVQATGRDQRGRKQYRYHPLWTACRDEVKYATLAAFARALPRMRRRVRRDLALKGVPRERVLAAVVWLLDRAMIRIGNETYRRQNKSFGLTTLRARHVAVRGASLRFAFRGKSGKEWNLRIEDRRIAKVIRSVQDLPGQHLFQYRDEDGSRRPVASQDVNDYIRAASGGEPFSSKQFRTWGGTVLAARLLSGTPLLETKRERARSLNEVIDAVAAQLGNTRAICRRCYIHPGLISSWEEGRLAEELADVRARLGRPPAGLARNEAVVLAWLEREGG
ncbi:MULTISPECIES: DNA topoisomerase IB [unclassified Chelatococcus]|uniref:DNA topoisomerase IB n=1 Tax=unclassified Chelatococcus TaxID=2638111 RepID=UPI00031ADB2A|nr:MULTISPECIES: DNA topoisomerase IB [unclassified Chelatococcus]ALA19181.1 DNA topoisomerase [Chelatococcus sp. CO-6]